MATTLKAVPTCVRSTFEAFDDLDSLIHVSQMKMCGEIINPKFNTTKPDPKDVMVRVRWAARNSGAELPGVWAMVTPKAVEAVELPRWLPINLLKNGEFVCEVEGSQS